MSREIEVGDNIEIDDTDPTKLIFRSKVNLAQVSITHPATPATVTVVGTGDPDLDPSVNAANFVQVANEYTPALAKGDALQILPDGRVKVTKPGTVVVTGYADVSHSNNNTTVGVAFQIERSAAFVLSPRTVHAMPNAGDIGNICGVGSLDAQVDDIIGIAVASSVSGTINFRSSSLVYEFKG